MASLRKVAISGKSTVKILKWHVKQGQEVEKNAVLASYVYSGELSPNTVNTERKLKSRFQGKVTKILAKQDEEVPPSEPVIIINEDHCMHTIIMKDMCCQCGEDLRRDIKIPGQLSEPVAAEIPMVHNIPELRVSVEEAERIARYDERQLLKSRKLALVVDLDQTLIHTTHEAVPHDLPDVFHYKLPDHPFEYHTKLRPGAKTFLQTVAKFYELHIFTMGSRMYAHTIARHLDPDEKLFAHRIRSRDECLDGFSKSRDLRALFPCGDHMVCIIDDREDIWDLAPNLITVKPYRFFKGTGDINDPFGNTENPNPADVSDEGEDNKEKGEAVVDKSDEKDEGKENVITGKDEEGNGSKVKVENEASSENHRKVKEGEGNGLNEKKEEADSAKEGNEDSTMADSNSNGADHPPDLDDYLFYLEEILERVHGSFYSTLDAIKAKGGLARQDPDISRFCTPGTVSPDARAIIPSLKQQVLKGSNLVFTGVIPTNVLLKNSTVYRTAISLGAIVTDNIVSSKNHDVDKSLYTTHVVAARLGTEKAYRASRIRNVKLVGVDWLWCCAQRWEWVDERLFPVSSHPPDNGAGTPEVSSRGTPVPRERTKNKGSKKNRASSREAHLVGNDRVPTPDEILETIVPISFNRDEFDEMDKEVEEYMLSDEDDNGEQQDVLGSVSGSSGRSSASSSSSSSSTSSQSSNSSTHLESLKKKRKELNDQLDFVRKRRREMGTESSELKDDSQINSNSSSSGSSENSNSSEDDLQIGQMLEKQIDE